MPFDWASAMTSFARTMQPGLEMQIRENQQLAAEQRAAEAEDKRQRKQRLFTMGREMAEAGAVEDVDAIADHFSPEVAEMLRNQAQRVQNEREANELGNVLNELARRGLIQAPGTAPTPGAVPTPGGLEVGTIGVTPGKAPRVELRAVPTEEKKFRKAESTRKYISRLQQSYMDVHGWDANQSRIAAVHRARNEGRNIIGHDEKLLDLAPPQAPGTGGAPSGQAPDAGAPVGPAAQLAAEKSRAEYQASLKQPAKGTYVDPVTLEILPSGMLKGEIFERGGKEIDATTRKALVSVRSIDGLIDEIEEITKVLFKTDDPYKAAANSARYAKKELGRVGDKEGKMIAKLRALKLRAGQLAQALGGEAGGKLSEGDVNRVFAAIPGLRGPLMRETKGTADQLVADMRRESIKMKRNLVGLPEKEAPTAFPGNFTAELEP